MSKIVTVDGNVREELFTSFVVFSEEGKFSLLDIDYNFLSIKVFDKESGFSFALSANFSFELNGITLRKEGELNFVHNISISSNKLLAVINFTDSEKINVSKLDIKFLPLQFISIEDVLIKNEYTYNYLEAKKSNYKVDSYYLIFSGMLRRPVQ